MTRAAIILALLCSSRIATAAQVPITPALWAIPAIEEGDKQPDGPLELDDQDIRRRLRIGHGATPGGGGSAPTLLTMADITFDGCFLSTDFNPGSWTRTNPAAFRYITGNARRWMQLSGDGHIYVWDEPTLKPDCQTAADIAALNKPTLLENWGPIPNLASSNSNNAAPPTDGYSYVYGLKWDEPSSQLLGNWGSGYTNIPAGSNTMFSVTFGTPVALPGVGTLNLVSCWGFQSVPTPHTMTGVADIPSWFQTNYSAYLPSGARLAAGFGGTHLASALEDNSYGLTTYAFAPPSANGCPSGQDNDILTANRKVMSAFPANVAANGGGGGPSCDPGLTGPPQGATIGCTPGSGTPSGSVPPTTPYPMITSHTGYSVNHYLTSWDPYGGHGWLTASGFIAPTWYDTGVGGKTGLVMFFSVPAGWANTPVLGSPAPTVSYPNITFSVNPSAAHGANDMFQVNDLIFVETCDPAIDTDATLGGPCIDNGNGHNLSWAKVDSYNTGAGAITAHIVEADFGNGATGHKPFVGGRVTLGTNYTHAAPNPSRADLRVQIIPPTQLGEVLAGTRASYNVIYSEDVPLSNWAAPFGCPSCATKGIITYGAGDRKRPVMAVSDPINHKIFVIIENANASNNTLFMRFSVAP